MRVLAFETSCDDTGVAIYDSDQGLLTQNLHQQNATHQPYGGVVPELASRDHSLHIIRLLRQTLSQCNLSLNDIDAIAYTAC